MYPKNFAGWLQRLLVVISQAFNALLLMGSPDETVSARAYRTPWPRLRRILDTIFFWEAEHCRRSYQRDIEFARKLLGR